VFLQMVPLLIQSILQLIHFHDNILREYDMYEYHFPHAIYGQPCDSKKTYLTPKSINFYSERRTHRQEGKKADAKLKFNTKICLN